MKLWKLPDFSQWKNPKEGRSLEDGVPDGPALPEYPVNFPKPAGGSVENAIHNKTENEKTFYQQGHDQYGGGENLDEKQKKGK